MSGTGPFRSPAMRLIISAVGLKGAFVHPIVLVFQAPAAAADDVLIAWRSSLLSSFTPVARGNPLLSRLRIHRGQNSEAMAADCHYNLLVGNNKL